MPELVNKGIGLASAFAGGASAYTDRERIQAEAAKHKLQKNVANAQNDPNAIQAQVEALTAQNKAIIGKQAKTETYSAFDMYRKTGGNLNSIKQILQSNPTVRKAWRGITTVEKVNPEYDQALLNKAGIKEFNPFVHIKGITPDGQEQIINMQNMMLGTGYLSPSSGLTQTEIDQMVQEQQLFGKPGDKPKPGPAERDAKYYESQGVTTLGGKTGEASIAQSMFSDKTGGNAMGQLDAAEQAGVALDKTFAETGGFMNTPMTDENRLIAAHGIHSLEKLYGISIPPKQMGELIELGGLTALAETAIEKLTPEVTGKLDTMLQTAKNYVSNSVEDVDKVQARSAYSMFRNTMRHALYGSALTPAEIQAFNETLGTLGQKYPAVIAQFRTAMEHTKATVEGLYGMNDPRLIHYYGGTTKEKLGAVIKRADAMLANLAEVQAKQDALITPEPTPADVQTDQTPANADKDAILNQLFPPLSGGQ